MCLEEEQKHDNETHKQQQHEEHLWRGLAPFSKKTDTSGWPPGLEKKIDPRYLFIGPNIGKLLNADTTNYYVSVDPGSVVFLTAYLPQTGQLLLVGPGLGRRLHQSHYSSIRLIQSIEVLLKNNDGEKISKIRECYPEESLTLAHKKKFGRIAKLPFVSPKIAKAITNSQIWENDLDGHLAFLKAMKKKMWNKIKEKVKQLHEVKQTNKQANK